MTLCLINARPSPYGRKVAIALREKVIPFDVRYDQPWGDASCTPEYSPLEQLPILILDSGETIYESSFILDWIELRYPQFPLLPEQIDDLIAVRQLKMLGERLMEVIHSITFELQRPDPGGAWVERQSRKVIGAMVEIDRRTGALRPPVDNPITLADIAVGSTLLVIDFLIDNGFVPALDVLKWKERHPSLAAYAAALDARPSFRETRPTMMDVDLKAVVG